MTVEMKCVVGTGNYSVLEIGKERCGLDCIVSDHRRSELITCHPNFKTVNDKTCYSVALLMQSTEL
jgi:hypothetical protein